MYLSPYVAGREIAASRERRARRALTAFLALEESSRHLVDVEDTMLLQFQAERARTAAADVNALKVRRQGGETSSSQRTIARSSTRESRRSAVGSAGYRVLLRVDADAGTVLTASGADAGITMEQVSEAIRHRFR